MLCFFFSSRRRHTRWPRDWSSDVCSSDLILERSIDRMRYLDEILSGRVSLVMSSSLQIEESVAEADVVIGAVLIPGALAPKLVTREMIGDMTKGAVVVDVAIDQGGCFETSRPTTHSD